MKTTAYELLGIVHDVQPSAEIVREFNEDAQTTLRGLAR